MAAAGRSDKIPSRCVQMNQGAAKNLAIFLAPAGLGHESLLHGVDRFHPILRATPYRLYINHLFISL